MRPLLLLLLSSPAFAEEPRRAFCELTPCVPGTSTRVNLIKDEPGGPVTCAKGSELGRDTQTKKLVFCTTAKAVIVDGIPIAAKAYTLFHPNGRIYQSHASAAFDRTLADGSSVRCAAELFALEPTGTLRYCDLAAPRAGSPKPRVGEGISFYPSGRVAGMTIDEAYQAAGNTFAAGTRLAWDDRGGLRGGWVKNPITVGALTIDANFELYPNGTLRIAQLSNAATLRGHAFPDNAKLTFRSDGTLERASYISQRGVMIHGEEWTDTRSLSFDKAGKITSDHTQHWQSDVRPPKFRK